LDFLINSPGGFAEVTESIAGMIRSKYKHVRFAIPNMAKSAATLLVLSGDELLMDHRSELGPVDPQVEIYVH
jgi:ClpP class serine protease